MKKTVLFNINEVKSLAKAYRKIYAKQEDEYEIGVTQGIDFIFYLFERMED